MSMTDPIADMLVRIKNALAVGKPQVSMPASKMKLAIAKVLKDEGYISDFSMVGAGAKSGRAIARTCYEGKPVIARLERVSRSGLRQRRGKNALPKVLAGLGVAILSTSKGLMTDRQARAQGVGGEVICLVA